MLSTHWETLPTAPCRVDCNGRRLSTMPDKCCWNRILAAAAPLAPRLTIIILSAIHSRDCSRPRPTGEVLFALTAMMTGCVRTSWLTRAHHRSVAKPPTCFMSRAVMPTRLSSNSPAPAPAHQQPYHAHSIPTASLHRNRSAADRLVTTPARAGMPPDAAPS